MVTFKITTDQLDGIKTIGTANSRKKSFQKGSNHNEITDEFL
jgi:hypothetical protein